MVKNISKRDLFKFSVKIKEFEKLMGGQLVNEIGTEARNFFTASFRNQGFTDSSLTKWQEVKRRIPGTPEYKYPKNKDKGRRSRRILNKTGRLQGSLQYRRLSRLRVSVYTNVPYATYINNGTKNMPARRFLGRSQVFNRKAIGIIRTEMKRIF